MPEGERDTICISSQVGCPVDCKFCMTALLGLERNLTAGEIVGQVLLVGAREPAAAQDGGRLNIVMMGQGEPLLNLANVLKATRILLDPAGFGLSPRRITVSTAGIVPKIDELGREPVRPKLAISLNASTEEIAAGADADHAQVPSEGSDGGVPGLSAAAVGEADLRIRAAEGRERHATPTRGAW